MRHFPRLLVLVCLLTGAARGVFAATTVDDLVKLTASGVSDEILIAHIQAEGSVFHLSADDIIAVRKRGLSDQVVLAMIRNGQKTTTAVTSTAQVRPAVIDDSSPEPAQTVAGHTTVAEKPPVVVQVTQSVVQHVQPAAAPVIIYDTVPVAVPVYVQPVAPVPPPPPVYWGFGGQRRPDSWGPSPAPAASTPAKP